MEAIIFCHSCASKVHQSTKRARTICPYCGSFFQQRLSCTEDNLNVVVKSGPDVKLKVSKPEREKNSWFSNLRRKSSSASRSGQKPSSSSSSSGGGLVLPTMAETRMIRTGGMSPREKNTTATITRSRSKGALTIDGESNGAVGPSHDDRLPKIVLDNLEKQEWDLMSQNLKEIFSTLRCVYFHFHTPSINTDIEVAKVTKIYGCGLHMELEYQECLIKVIEASLKEINMTKISSEEILALIVLLLNPMLDRLSFYYVYILIINLICSLPRKMEQSTAIIILLRLPIDSFRQILQRTHNLLTHCLFVRRSRPPPESRAREQTLPTERWKEKCTKFIAFLNAANNRNRITANRIKYIDFYNCSIDQENLQKYYTIWLDSHFNEFSFCQYPCVMSINAKKKILQTESENQMVVLAKQTLISTLKNNQVPDFEMAFLNLSVRRDHLVLDSMNEILSKRNDLKKKLKVTFVGEPGLDMGGLTKEWFLLILRQILFSKASVFYYDPLHRLNWFLKLPKEREYTEFYLTGVLMGLAVYNSIGLDVRFPLVCYRKLLSPPMSISNSERHIGICPVSFADLGSVYPDLANGLKELLTYEGDVEHDICATFEVSYKNYQGETVKHCLKPGGDTIMVTKNNRKEYVDMYANFLLNTLIEAEFRAFYQGFHSVCKSNALMLLRAEEVETLVCGSPIFDVAQLRKSVVYDGYSENDRTIVLFWEILMELSEALQKLFLHFTTGSDRIPVGGAQDMQLKISKANNRKRLPMAYTCFNQLLLPPYSEKNELKLKLLISMENSEGFGLK